MNTVYKSASLGGQQVLPCEVVYPPNQKDTEFVVTWRKGSLGLNLVLLTKIDGYSPTIHDEYRERLEIVNKASLQISHIETKDQDWYQCSIMFVNAKPDTTTNNTWIYLTVHSPPQITRSSATLTNMARGESVKLFCEGKGSPEPRVTWMKDGHTLNNTIRTTIEANEVRIVNLQREDGGIYTCTFTNIVGDRSQPIKLVIEGGPYIMTQPGNQTVLEGQRVNFPCGTEGYPNIISHVWFKDQVDVRTSDGYKAGRITILPEGSLVIKTAVKADKGLYLCRASNGLGHDEASAYLNVVYKPAVLPLPSQLIWAKGYRQQIDCPVDSNPPLLHIIWVKDQEQLQSKGRFDVLDNGTLLVSDVMDVDAGSYRCTPENAMGQGLSSNRVQVMVKDPPQITVSPQVLYIRNVGESVTMNCEATGTPAVSLQWIKVAGKLDGNSARISITDQHLEIRNLTKEDHGRYECRAINTIATVVSVTELRIDNTTPHAPYNVTVVPGLFNVTISWEPAYDGGTPQYYVLWFRQLTQFEWLTMAVPSPAATYFNLYSLQPDTEYEFKILSRNSFGNGSFSDVVRQRTLGYSPEAVNVLPTDKDGVSYHPEININHGPEPSVPVDVAAQVKDRNILLTWRTPPMSPVPIFSYKIEYQHDGRWQLYESRIVGNTTNTAVMSDMPTGTYEIYLRSYGVLAYSPLSNVARVYISGVNKPAGSAGASSSSDDVVIPQAMVGGIIGGVLFLLVAILLALVAVFYSRRKERKAKEKKYDDVNYGKPDEMNGRHHEYAAKRDRWQHNGRGDIVTSLDNTDSIFFLPQTRSLNQSASMMRPLILLDNKNDKDSLYGRGVTDRTGYDRDYGRQVPLTVESSFMIDRSQLETFKPEQTRLDVRNLTWANQQQHNVIVEQQALSRSLQPTYGHIPESYIPTNGYTPPQEHLQYSSVPQDHPVLLKSLSVPSHHAEGNTQQITPLIFQYPNHSIHNLSSQSHPTYSPTYPPSSQTTPHDPSHRINLSPNQPPLNSEEYQSFQSDDDGDVFVNSPQPSGHHHHHVPGFPRHSSLKPSYMTYLVDDDDNEGHQLGSFFELKDISSVLEPSSEQQSQLQPIISHDTLPSSHPFNRSNIEDDTSRPGYYIHTGDTTQPFTMVTPNQRHLFNSSGASESSWPQGYTQDHIQENTEQFQNAPRTISQESRLRLNPNISGLSEPIQKNRTNLDDYYSQLKHSNLRVPSDYNTLDSRDSNENILHNPFYQSEHMIEPYYYNQLPRPRAQSEGSRGKKRPPYSGHYRYGVNQNFPNSARPPYSSASYSDVSLPQNDRTALGEGHREQHLRIRDTDDQNYNPNVHLNNDQIQHQPFHHPHHQPTSSLLIRGTTTSPIHQISSKSCSPVVEELSPRDSHSTLHAVTKHGYPGSYYGDHSGRHYGDDALPADVGSHSSGIGSRNTSQSTNSYHVHYRGSGGKGSASLSSGQGHDMSQDMISGLVIGHPSHRRDTSGDENYEFDSLNALENDIMDDLRRYSQLSEGSGNANYSHGSDQHDSSVFQANKNKSSQYPDSERRFEKLREEFKQYRQQQYYPSDGSVQLPPTASSALPIGMNGEPLYPMDSEML